MSRRSALIATFIAVSVLTNPAGALAITAYAVLVAATITIATGDTHA